MNILSRLYYVIIDKLFSVVNLLESEDEFRSYQLIKDYSQTKLGDFDYHSNGELIWNTLFSSDIPIAKNEIDRVYNIKRTVLLDDIYNRLKLYIKHKLWSLFDNYEVDTWNWTDEEAIYKQSLYFYLFILKSGNTVIVSASLKDKKFDYIESFECASIPINKIKKRQITYRDGFFYCI